MCSLREVDIGFKNDFFLYMDFICFLHRNKNLF